MLGHKYNFIFQKGNLALMTEEELTENLKMLLVHLIDEETLYLFGWPDESIDVVCYLSYF